VSTKRRRKNRLPPFVPLIKATMATPAWRAMSPGARLLYIELRGRLRNDYANNGKVWLSCRDAADTLGTKSTRSIVRWFAENEHYGFLRKTGDGFLGSDGRGIAARYRFTEFPCEGLGATRDFEKWDGKSFVYNLRRLGRKKQNPVSPRDTPRVPEGHIRKRFEGGSVCIPEGHIDSSAKCVPEGHVSRRTSRGGHRPGSMAERRNGVAQPARAAAQPADAGSSPAPVTSPRRMRSCAPSAVATMATSALAVNIGSSATTTKRNGASARICSVPGVTWAQPDSAGMNGCLRDT
jgi:hypothetical protein